MSQTAVAAKQVLGLPGQIATLYGAADAKVDSATNTEASAEIVPGIMVARGTPDGSAILLHTSAAAMAANQLLLGVSVLDHFFAEPQEWSGTGYKPKTTFSVLMQGPIIVVPEDAVTPASDVRVRVVVAGAEVKGAFRAAADSTDCVEITAFARWMTSAAGGQPAVLWVDMSNVALAVADT